jgi:hypothetical protein
MTGASAAFGYLLSREPVVRRFVRLAPGLTIASMAFGVWYGLGALEAVPYAF